MTLRLDGDQFKRLLEAILVSYADQDQLEELLLFELEKHMQEIVSRGANYRKAVREVISTAQQEGWLLHFVEKVYRGRQNDPNLQRLYEELQPAMEVASMDPYEVRFLRKGWVILGRQNLRYALKDLIEHDSRILIVEGHPVSGKTYTAQLISFLKERLTADSPPIAWVDLSDLTQAAGDKRVSSTDIGEWIASQWGLTGVPSLQNEQETRWVWRFSNWLTGELKDSGPKYWIVIDHFDKALWDEGVEHLIGALATQIYRNLPMVRLVLLSYKDKDSLQSKVQGPVEYEFIQPIGENELRDFFILEHKDREKRCQIAYSADSVADSVTRVMRKVDPDHPLRLKHLMQEVAAEVSRL